MLATWAADCAERVLPLFETACPGDDRPRTAIEACRTWVCTGVFRMADIRGASLAAHAAAREAKEHAAASYSARAAGHAVATAHVPQHAFGSSVYALKAVAASDPANAESVVLNERDWQVRQIPKHLRDEFVRRVTIRNKGNRIAIGILKDRDF